MKRLIILLLVAGLILTGCGHDHTHDNPETDNRAKTETTNIQDHDHGEAGHSHSHDESISTGGGHDHGEESLTYTVWGDNTELFVEFTPLVVGNESHFVVHLTKLSNYSPIDHVHLHARLKQSGGIINLPEAEMVTDGIFEIPITPATAGKVQIEFNVDVHDFTDVILLETEIYNSEAEGMDAVLASEAEAADKINFTKEQIWNTDFATELVSVSPVSEVITTSGQLVPAPGDEFTISAEVEGIVKYNGIKPLVGQPVSKNDIILKLLSSGIDNNLSTRYQQAKAEYEKDKANVERAEKMLTKNFISQKEFDEIRTEFITAKTNFETLSKNFQNNSQLVKAGMKGFVKAIHVNEGDYVETGQPLIIIAMNKRVLLKADLSQKYYNKIPELSSASFRAAHSTFYYNTAFLNGKLLSFGKTVSVDNHLLPVYFEIDNITDILPGSFLEISLMTDPKRDAVTIPKEALVEEFGSYSVYVQAGGETFEKRQVKLGVFDGFNYEVISGINPGDRVVTRGAFQVKIASMSNAIPGHGHEH